MHGIILTGIGQEHPTYHILEQKISGTEDFSVASVKRGAGAYRIATHLRSHGWDVEVLDFFSAWEQDELEEFFESRITKDTHFVGISVIFSEPTLVSKYNKIISWLKENYPDVMIFCGSKNLISTFLINGDYHLTGYGEHGVIELLKFKLGKESSVVPQDIYIDKFDRHIKWINCDTECPAYPHEDMTITYQDRDFLQEHEVLTLEFSRGCKFKCSFCSYNILGFQDKTLRDMDIARNELQTNFDKWGISHYVTADETFNANPSNLSEIAKMVGTLPFTLDMAGFIRADLLVANKHTWDDLLQIGHWAHYYGIETFNNEAGKFIKKGMNPDVLKEGLMDVRKYFRKNIGKYGATASFIVGLPYEDIESIRRTYEWLHKVKGFSVSVFPLHISDQQDKYLSNNYSEFEREWRSSNLFYEVDEKDLDINFKRDFPDFEGAEEVYAKFQGTKDYITWAHNDMNYYEANKLVFEFFGSKYISWATPDIWTHHIYKLLGYTVEQICSSTLLQLVNFTNPKEVEKVISKYNRFFDEYKFKKLSYS